MPGSALIGWFADVGLDDRGEVGGKGGSLGELQRAGIGVPPGCVIKTAAFQSFLTSLEAQAPFRAQVASLTADDLPAVAACCDALRARVRAAPLPAAVTAAVLDAYTVLCGDADSCPVAVRSSATTEDAVDASFAGLQDTYLWVTDRQQLLQCVRDCWASLYSIESVSYRLRRAMPEDSVAMAVVVQRMVDARTAGVMFTRSPVTGDRSVITIEGAWGLGSAVVGGEVTPDRWVVGKITGEISTREISDKTICHTSAAGGGIAVVDVDDSQRRAPCLSDNELQALREIGRRVERHYGRAQDIEWAVEKATGRIVLLQSRPETVWSSRESQPVAQPAADPRAHVMSIFGGRK